MKFALKPANNNCKDSLLAGIEVAGMEIGCNPGQIKLGTSVDIDFATEATSKQLLDISNIYCLNHLQYLLLKSLKQNNGVTWRILHPFCPNAEQALVFLLMFGLPVKAWL